MLSLVIILVFFSLGGLVKRFIALPANLPYQLNQFVISICLPAIVLLKIPQLTIDKQWLLIIVLAWIAMFFCALCVVFMAKTYHWPKPIIGALLMTAVLGNTSYFGFPMVKLLFPDSSLAYAIVYDQIGTFLGLAIYGSIIIALFGDNEKINSGLIVKKILTFPPFIALIVSLLLPIQPLIELLSVPLTWLATLLIPLTMFIVGMQFSLKLQPDYQLPLLIGLTIKMIITPAILYLLLQHDWVPINQYAADVTIFEAAMPPMVTAGVMAMNANLAPKLAAAMIGFGLLLASVTVPFWWVVLR
jgi:hypothetical protein